MGYLFILFSILFWYVDFIGYESKMFFNDCSLCWLVTISIPIVKIMLFGDEKHTHSQTARREKPVGREQPLVEEGCVGRVTVPDRGGRCSFFLMMRCVANVLDKTTDLDVLKNIKTSCSRCKLAMFFT